MEAGKKIVIRGWHCNRLQSKAINEDLAVAVVLSASINQPGKKRKKHVDRPAATVAHEICHCGDPRWIYRGAPPSWIHYRIEPVALPLHFLSLDPWPRPSAVMAPHRGSRAERHSVARLAPPRPPTTIVALCHSLSAIVGSLRRHVLRATPWPSNAATWEPPGHEQRHKEVGVAARPPRYRCRWGLLCMPPREGGRPEWRGRGKAGVERDTARVAGMEKERERERGQSGEGDRGDVARSRRGRGALDGKGRH